MAPACAAIPSANAAAIASGPNRLVSSSSRNSAVSGVSTEAPRAMPALLISTLTSGAAVAAAATDAGSVTSSATGTTRGSRTSTLRGSLAAA